MIEDILFFFLQAPLWKTALACTLLVVAVATNGLEHGHIWARNKSGELPAILQKLPVHVADEVQEVDYYLLAYLTGANAIAVFGAGLLSRILFEGAINLGVGRSFFDQGREPKDFVVRAFGTELYRRPKSQTRTHLILKAVLGAGLILAHPFLSQLLLGLI